MVARCRAVLPGKRKRGRWKVGGPMHANDSQGGKARDAQIIRGRLEREALGPTGPEIPVHRVPGTYGGGGSGAGVKPACREGSPGRVLAGTGEQGSGGLQLEPPGVGPHHCCYKGRGPPCSPVHGRSNSPSSFLLLISAPFTSSIVRHSVRPLEAARWNLPESRPRGRRMRGPGDEGYENLHKHCLICSFTPRQSQKQTEKFP